MIPVSGIAATIRLPEGYEKQDLAEGFQLGGGIMGGYVKTLKGYDPPHIAGRIRFHGMPADAVMPTSDRQMIPCSDVEKVLDSAWRDDQKEFGKTDIGQGRAPGRE